MIDFSEILYSGNFNKYVIRTPVKAVLKVEEEAGLFEKIYRIPEETSKSGAMIIYTFIDGENEGKSLIHLAYDEPSRTPLGTLSVEGTDIRLVTSTYELVFKTDGNDPFFDEWQAV